MYKTWIPTLIFLLRIMCGISGVDSGCLFGWFLNRNATECSIRCPTTFALKTNVNCDYLALKSLSLTYDSSSQILSIPSGTPMGPLTGGSTIPSCYKVTLTQGQYTNTSYGFVRISSYLMEIAPHLSAFSSANVTICYPSSPQLLQCDVIRTPLGSYDVVNGIELRLLERNFSAFLGDFFIDENKMAVTCADSITKRFIFNEIPRCNVIIVYPQDYRVNSNASVTLLRANFIVNNPLYAANYAQFLLLCVPLSFHFLNCGNKKQVSGISYVKLHNLSVIDIFYRQTHQPQSYFESLDGELTSCISENDEISAISVEICFYAFYFSTFFLFLTIIIRWKMFTRNFNGWCLLFHIMALMATYVVSGVKVFEADFKPFPCYFIFAANYFFMMATFLWLDVIAYDSFSYFSAHAHGALSSTSSTGCCSKGLRRFLTYNAIAWGLPCVMTATVLSMDLTAAPFDFSRKFQPDVLVPQYPFDYTMLPLCFFNSWKSVNLFWSLPLSVFMLINLTFMTLTIRVIHRAGRGTDMVNHRRRRQLFEISTRLFILMGLCWSIDCLAFLIGPYVTSVFQMWYVVLGLSMVAVQGFAIFFIYCARKEVFYAFQNKFCSPKISK